ncbi:pacearchaeosortase [Candidatus Pacearchaeota archaeon]|nr:pacearchaeosortase [Candidatus Pacearchaeota archaeon]
MSDKKVYLFARYLLIVLFGLFNLKFFYSVFTPLTIYPVYWIVSLFREASLSSNLVSLESFAVEIIPACVAGAAYYLLFILNLSTPIKIDKRIKSLVFLFLVFLAFNILRIVGFIWLFSIGYEYFDAAHNLVWHFGSTILLVLVWFVNVKLFKIKEIPVYSDFRKIFSEIKRFPKSSLSRSVAGTSSRDLKLNKFKASRRKRQELPVLERTQESYFKEFLVSLILPLERSKLWVIKPKWRIKW